MNIQSLHYQLIKEEGPDIPPDEHPVDKVRTSRVSELVVDCRYVVILVLYCPVSCIHVFCHTSGVISSPTLVPHHRHRSHTGSHTTPHITHPQGPHHPHTPEHFLPTRRLHVDMPTHDVPSFYRHTTSHLFTVDISTTSFYRHDNVPSFYRHRRPIFLPTPTSHLFTRHVECDVLRVYMTFHKVLMRDSDGRAGSVL